MEIGPMNRRGFLKTSFGTAALAPLWLSLSARAQETSTVTVTRSEKPRKVLVLGAGMSGLTAALALVRRGHEVSVIEYQGRVGGRLLSVPLKGGQFTEAGGGHFRSNMPYVLGYIHRFKLPLLALNDGLPRYYFGGQAADAAKLDSWPWELTKEERNVTVSTTLNRYLFLNGLDTDSVLSSHWPDPATVEQLDNLTLGQLISQVGASPAYLKLLDAHGGTFTSSSPALGVIPDLAYHFGDQNLFRIRGGNDRLPRAMAAEIGPERFVLGAPVVRIEQSGSGATVTVKDGREFRGDAIVCTIPFTVLQDIEMRPGWSARKQTMFKNFEWDKTVKVIAQTKTPSWLSQGVHGWPMAGSDRPWERVIDILLFERIECRTTLESPR
jgi:monoamine oxidase